MAKRHIAPLVSGRVRLRLLEEADLPMTLAWRNQDDIRKWFFSSDVITPDQHRRWFEQYRNRDDDFVFVIEETETLQRAIGQASIYNIAWAARRGEFGRLLIGDRQAVGLGLARMATELLVDEAMSGLGLLDVHLAVRSDNVPAIAVYRACGFARTDSRAGVDTMRVTRSPKVPG